MKALGSNIVKALTIGSRLLCNDNSGAKELMVIGAKGYKGRRGMNPKVGVADVVTASVKKGNPKMKKKIVKAVIVRQRKEWRRANGTRIQFEDNAAVLVDDDGLPVGTEVKGAIAREVSDRFPKVAAISSAVV